jgi:hypothetical protein
LLTEAELAAAELAGVCEEELTEDELWTELLEMSFTVSTIV